MAFQHPYAARNQRKLSASIAKQVASVIPKVATHLQSLQPQTSANHQSSTPTRHQIRVAALLTREVADAVSTVVTRLQTIQPQASANRQSSTPTRNQIGIAALITREVANAISTVSIPPQAPTTTPRRIFKHPQNNEKKRPYTGTFPLCNHCKFHHPNNSQCRICMNCGYYGHNTEKCRVQKTQQPPTPPAKRQRKSQYPPGTCFNCGDPTHYRNTCPRLVNTTNTQA